MHRYFVSYQAPGSSPPVVGNAQIQRDTPITSYADVRGIEQDILEDLRRNRPDVTGSTTVIVNNWILMNVDEVVARYADLTDGPPPQTRVVDSVGDPGKWQAQYYDQEKELWFDIGDAKVDKVAAEANEVDFRTGNYRLR